LYFFPMQKLYLWCLQFCPCKNCNCVRVENVYIFVPKFVWECLQFSSYKKYVLSITCFVLRLWMYIWTVEHNLTIVFYFYSLHGCVSACLDISSSWFSQHISPFKIKLWRVMLNPTRKHFPNFSRIYINKLFLFC